MKNIKKRNSKPRKEVPYLLYGRRVIEEFLRSSHDPNSVKNIYFQDGTKEALLASLRSKCHRASFWNQSRQELDLLCDGHHQGLVLEFASEDYPAFAKEKPRAVFQKKAGPYLCLDRIQDVQNLGSILRTAEALGVSHIFLSSKCAPLDARAHRAASGASLHLSIYEAGNLNRLFSEAKKAGLWLVSSASEEDYHRIFEKTVERTSAKSQAKPKAPDNQSGEFVKKNKNISALQTSPLFLWHTDSRALPEASSLLLVIGNEGEGVQPLLLKNSDYILSIRMQGKTASLNAGVAAGILLDRIVFGSGDATSGAFPKESATATYNRKFI